MKTHWLYGLGPNKEIKFKKEISNETNCLKCVHLRVCDRDTNKRCVNLDWGTSVGHTGCDHCLHKYTRWDKDKIPCFRCNFFVKKRKRERPKVNLG